MVGCVSGTQWSVTHLFDVAGAGALRYRFSCPVGKRTLLLTPVRANAIRPY
ncbi:MAG: hypothetical protein F6K39_12485 [Okeania sp. SIO3B3]|nr:hypothetical protein [Okeania sp. SIO3B3]